ncbi:A/B/D/E cyclin [Auriscalpium vulgare]|uniref:A/B/D/E cyclin n=1 Tax=Auriscalpium vulgare TaxID=40419 RepID=A0ACB8RFD1_9AGAM|nr:A/B/D/E cyclin [Auriscalpium vulgare]
MASNIPTRRVTRTTRTNVLKDENALARPRIATRTKPPSASNATANTAGPARASAATASTRAKAVSKDSAAEQDPAAQGKRKRSAFGEVVVNKPKAGAAAAKGKVKDEASAAVTHAPSKFAGVVIKSKTTTTTTTTTAAPASRQVLRTVVAPSGLLSKRVTRSSGAAEHVHDGPKPRPESPTLHEPMAIDPPNLPAPPRRLPHTRKSATIPSRRTSGHSIKHEPEADEDLDIEPVHKKRRTSSEAPEEFDEEAQEEVQVEDHVNGATAELERHMAEISYEAEADPDGDGWVDLDAEDADDPLMVSEYVLEIFEYMKVVEQTTLPNPNYMENQKDLAWKMRGILTDWLVQVHMRFRLLPETLFLCVNIIDRFLSARVVSLAKLQLVGITCMFLAAKVEEIVAPSSQNFLYCADSSYNEAEILQAEKYILKTLDWNMGYPNPIHFLRRVSKADDYNVQVRTVAKYLMEIQCVEWRLIAAPPSLLAAAAIWLARLILGYENWSPNLAHYSSYAESALVPTANLMLNYVLKPIRHPSFYKKYAAKKYYKTSSFVREWALERWPENVPVNLVDELPSLKALIRAARTRAVEAGLDPYAAEPNTLHALS